MGREEAVQVLESIFRVAEKTIFSVVKSFYREADRQLILASFFVFFIGKKLERVWVNIEHTTVFYKDTTEMPIMMRVSHQKEKPFEGCSKLMNTYMMLVFKDFHRVEAKYNSSFHKVETCTRRSLSRAAAS